MTTTLEDIRVGDIMLCPDGEERKVEQCSGDMVHAGDDIWYRRLSLRNPEFRVGDTARPRGVAFPTAVVVKAWTRDGRLAIAFSAAGMGHYAEHYALVERAPVEEKKPLIMPVPPLWKPAPPSCPFCNHPGEKHYAGCCSRDPQTMEPHTGSEGLMHHAVSRIQHLGWDQPAPIVVLCQNEEDVP